jgi:hypothetical protein
MKHCYSGCRPQLLQIMGLVLETTSDDDHPLDKLYHKHCNAGVHRKSRDAPWPLFPPAITKDCTSCERSQTGQLCHRGRRRRC